MTKPIAVVRGDSISLGRRKIGDILPKGSMHCQISCLLGVGKRLPRAYAAFSVPRTTTRQSKRRTTGFLIGFSMMLNTSSTAAVMMSAVG